MDGADQRGRERLRRGRGAGRRISPLEVLASLLGLGLTLGMLAFIGWEALSRPGEKPPAVYIEAGQVTPLPSGGIWVLEFVAVNRAPATAANVEVEGVLRQGGRRIATSRTVLDFVPGGSSRRGGLFFATDPSGHEIELRALGYVRP